MSIPLQPGQFELKDKPVPSMPRRKVAIRKMLPTQITFDPEKVKSMAQRDADDFDKVPVIGKRPDGAYDVIDGHHRIARGILKGEPTCDVRIVK